MTRTLFVTACLVVATTGCGNESGETPEPAGALDGSAGSAGAAGSDGDGGQTDASDAIAEDGESSADALKGDAPEGADAGDASPPDDGGALCLTAIPCDDDDPTTSDSVGGDGGCVRVLSTGPSALVRQDADLLCEQSPQGGCQDPPTVRMDFLVCADQPTLEQPPHSWWDNGYPLRFWFWKSDVPGSSVGVHLTLRVGEYDDEFEVVQTLEPSGERSLGTFSAKELDDDALVVEMISSQDAWQTLLWLRPAAGYLRSRALQFSLEGVTDLETQAFHSVGCDGDSWSVYGLFRKVPPHGVLRLGDSPTGDGACVGEVVRLDGQDLPADGFARLTCEPTVWKIAADRSSRRRFAGGGAAFSSWLTANGVEPVTFCGQELQVVPDAILAAIPEGPPIEP